MIRTNGYGHIWRETEKGIRGESSQEIPPRPDLAMPMEEAFCRLARGGGRGPFARAGFKLHYYRCDVWRVAFNEEISEIASIPA